LKIEFQIRISVHFDLVPKESVRWRLLTSAEPSPRCCRIVTQPPIAFRAKC